jgi:TetR/AcrR family transcriptional regulator
MPPSPPANPKVDSVEIEAECAPRRAGRPRSEDGSNREVADRLLDAATELAVEQGFEACGLREIAARADVSSGMIAYYFGDRQGLYEAMFQRAIDRVGAKVMALLESPSREGSDRLDDLVHLHVSAIAADPWLPKLILREILARTDSSLKITVADQVGHGPMRMMVQWIKEEQAEGILRKDLDPGLMAMTLASLSAFPFVMLPIIGEEIGVELDADFPTRLIEHNQRLLARGIRASPENQR